MTGFDRDGRPAAWLTLAFSAAPTVLGVVAFGYWLVTNQNQLALTAHDFANFQQTSAMQFGDIRARLDDIQSKISTLPDQRAQIAEIMRRLDQDDASRQSRIKALETVQEGQIVNRADIARLRGDVDALLEKGR